MIKFSHVTKIYDGQFEALSDVSLFIDKGEFVFLTGASGAGKTTLLKHIYMEEKPTKGEVFSCGYESKTVKPSDVPFLRRKLGIVFQDYRLLNDRNVFDNVAFTLRVCGFSERKIKRKVFETLAKTGLSHKSSYYPEQLSGGEQQRVSIARAIVNDPYILIADEPTGNLNKEIAEDIFDLLRMINSLGTTVIMSTHQLWFIERYHYRQIILDRGTLIKGQDITLKPKIFK